MALLDAADVPFAPINDFAEVMADPQVRHLGTFARYQHAERGMVDVIRPPLFMDGRRPIRAGCRRHSASTPTKSCAAPVLAKQK